MGIKDRFDACLFWLIVFINVVVIVGIVIVVVIVAVVTVVVAAVACGYILYSIHRVTHFVV